MFPYAVIFAQEQESKSITDPIMNGSFLFGSNKTFEETDEYYADGDEIDFYNRKIKIMQTPGHTSGSVCIVADDNIFTGDTLFREGIGRSDLPGGNSYDLDDSLKKLMILDDATKVFPGHGRATTIKHEKSSNPFVLRLK